MLRSILSLQTLAILLGIIRLVRLGVKFRLTLPGLGGDSGRRRTLWRRDKPPSFAPSAWRLVRVVFRCCLSRRYRARGVRCGIAVIVIPPWSGAGIRW